MSVIEKRIRLVGSKGSTEEVILFDSGSTYSVIRPDVAEKLGIVESLPEPMDFGTAEGTRTLRTEQAVRLNFHLNGYRFSDEFMLIPGLSEPAIIGAATLQKWRMKLDFENDEVIIDPRVTKLRLI
ncbi:MAG: retroviral-like aspartic protease [Chloroflexi bacterium]|nr:retroviral-like aspartic protease [Chloroflexota bacterium]